MNKDKQSESDINPTSSEEDRMLKAEVHILSYGRSFDVEFPPATTAEELIESIIKELNLPERGSFVEPTVWRLILRYESVQTSLRGKEVLGDLIPEARYVRLYLEPEMAAG